MDRVLQQLRSLATSGHSLPNFAICSSARISRGFACLLVSLLLLCSSGCSLVVMAGKAIMGDPKVTAPFTAATGLKLTEGEDAVVIIASAPHRLLSEHPALQIDIVDRVSRILEAQGVKVVSSGDVASWYDDHGEWGDYSDLAAAFEARYIMHVDFRKFDHRVPESENLLQGTAEGHISVHEVDLKTGIAKTLSRKNEYVPVSMVFDRDFSLQFPSSYPVPREAKNEEMFVQGFIDRVALHIGQHMYDYRMSESIH